VHTPRSAFTLGAFHVSWSARTPGSTVASYQLRYRRASYAGGFGRWLYPAAWRHLTTTSLRHAERPGWTDCFSVRVRTRAGLTSGWSRPRCTARPLDDRALATFGRWVRRTGRGYYARTVTATTAARARLTIRRAAVDRIALVATRCRHCGVVRVYDAGHLLATVNLRAARLRRRALIVLPRLRLRTGTVTIRVVSRGKPVQIDGLGLTRA
jgi:hypothetical protein